MSLANQKCMTQPTLISLHPKDYSQKNHYNGGKIREICWNL